MLGNIANCSWSYQDSVLKFEIETEKYIITFMSVQQLKNRDGLLFDEMMISSSIFRSLDAKYVNEAFELGKASMLKTKRLNNLGEWLKTV